MRSSKNDARIDVRVMSHYHFQVIQDDTGWSARRGSRVFASYDKFDDAVNRGRVEAALHHPSEVIVHLADGTQASDSTVGGWQPFDR